MNVVTEILKTILNKFITPSGINRSNMEERMFLVIVKGETNESEMSLKRAISEAIECETKQYEESPLYGCNVSVKEVED